MLKFSRLAGAILAALVMFAAPARAVEQSTFVMPSAGPMSMTDFVDDYLNPAFRAVTSCHWGTAAPANGPSSAPIVYQCWADTNANPVLFKRYDGASWVTFGSLNTSTHVWSTYGTLTNATGLPISTGVSGLGTGVATFLATPSSANLASAITDETGSGALVFATSPTLVTPALGTPSSGTLTNATGLPISTGVSGLGTGVATFLGTPSSSNLASAVTDETGSGALVFATSPTLVTPALGTPSSGTLTNATGLPISTGVSGLGTGVATALVTPSSANIAAAVTDETGSGALVFATSPALVTPDLGTPSAATLTNATGLPISTGVSGLGSGVATFLATPSSANLAAAVTNETGSGALVFATSPTLVTPALGTPSSGTLTNATGLPISTGVSGLGTGVATALGVNVGSAGAFVTFNGALGTPSSGTLTNATGLPISGLTGLGGGVADFLADTTADDQVWVGSSASAGAWKTIPDCTDSGGNHLNYTQSTNAFSCGSSSSGGGGGSVATDDYLQMMLNSCANARSLALAQFMGYRFCDSFGVNTRVDTAGATNLDTGTAGLLKGTTASATTGTFGAASAGSGRTLSTAAGANLGFQFTAPATGTITQIRYNIAVTRNTATAVARLYTNNSGSPGTQVGSDCGSVSTGTTGNKTFTCGTPMSMTNGTVYWIVVTHTSGTIDYDPDTATNQAGYGSGRNTTITSITDNGIGGNNEEWRIEITYSTGLNNVTVASTSIAVPANPATCVLYARTKHVDSATIGTDYNFYVSRDGGTTYSSAASMTDYFTDPTDDAHVSYSASVDVSGQPSGANVRIKWITSNNKNLELRDWGFRCAP